MAGVDQIINVRGILDSPDTTIDEKVQALLHLQDSDDINAPVYGGSTLMHVFSRHKHMLPLLLEVGVDINATDIRGFTALEEVCSGFFTFATAEFFLSNGSRNPENALILYMAGAFEDWIDFAGTEGIKLTLIPFVKRGIHKFLPWSQSPKWFKEIFAKEESLVMLCAIVKKNKLLDMDSIKMLKDYL